MKVLHIVRAIDDQRALATAHAHAQQHPTTLVLLQDAVLTRLPTFPGPVFACAEDVMARSKVGNYLEIDYDRIIQLIFEADRVITW